MQAAGGRQDQGDRVCYILLLVLFTFDFACGCFCELLRFTSPDTADMGLAGGPAETGQGCADGRGAEERQEGKRPAHAGGG